MIELPFPDQKLLTEFFATIPELLEVKVYGSRAIGTSKPGSDIDIAIRTCTDDDCSGIIRGRLDALPLPYFFDVLDYDRLEHGQLKEHIDQFSIVFYQKD